MNQSRTLVLVLALLAALTAMALALGFGQDPDDLDGGPGANAAEIGDTDTHKGKALIDAVDTVDASDTEDGEKREEVAGRAKSAADGDATRGIRGRLVKRDGTALAGVTLSFQPIRVSGAFRRILLDSVRPPVPGSSITAKSDDQGRFLLPVGEKKHGRLSVVDPVFVLVRERWLVDSGDGDKDLGEVEAMRASSVSGQVIASGVAVEGVELRIGGESRFGLSTGAAIKSDEDGRFEIRQVRPGKRTLVTSSPRFKPAREAMELVEGQRKELIITLAEGRTLRGTVVDDLGQPVAGAKVVASRSRNVSPGVQVRGFTAGESTESAASGEFQLGGLDEAVDLRATKDGYSLATSNKVPTDRDGITLTMSRQGSVTGVLVDEDGKPIAGSEVQASRVGGGMRMMMMFKDRLVRTDAEGRFTLRNVDAGANRIVANGERHVEATDNVEVKPGEKASDLRLVARRGATLTVTVFDERDRPVADAEVRVASAKDEGNFNFVGRRGATRRVMRRARRAGGAHGDDVVIDMDAGDTAKATTDENGVAVLRGLAADKMEVTAKHAAMALLAPSLVEVPDGGEIDTKLQMRQGGFVAVTVVDTDDDPFPGASFLLRGPIGVGAKGASNGRDSLKGMLKRSSDDAEPSEKYRTGGEGKKRVGPLQPGNYEAVLLRPDAPRKVGESMSFSILGDDAELRDSKLAFTVPAGEAAEVRLRMPVMSSVTGIILDARGPAVGAEVEVVAKGSIRLPMMGKHKARTGEDGRFRIDGLSSGDYTIYWNEKGAPIASEKPLVLHQNQAIHEEELMLAGAVVRLQVKDALEGFGVDEATVEIEPYRAPKVGSDGVKKAPRQRRAMMISFTSEMSSGGSGPTSIDVKSGSRTVQTNDKGRVEITSVPDGTFTLTIKHRDYAKVQKKIVVVRDQTLDLGVIKVVPGCRVRGRVEFEEKGEMDMALVEIRDAQGKSHGNTISRDGRFKFTSLAPGTYKVRARSISDQEWGPATTAVVTPDDSPRIKVSVPKPK